MLAVGGSAEIPGAVVLAATAALRAGAGKLQIATVRSVATHGFLARELLAEVPVLLREQEGRRR